MRSRWVALVMLAFVPALVVAQGTPDPAQIEVVVSGGANDTLDNQHAQYKPGSTLKLSAVVRDASGQIIQNPAGKCTPVFDVTDNVSPDQFHRGFMRGPDTLVFGKAPGVFTVGAHCMENPQVQSHNAPIQFETDSGTFARCDGEGCGNPNLDQLENEARGLPPPAPPGMNAPQVQQPPPPPPPPLPPATVTPVHKGKPLGLRIAAIVLAVALLALVAYEIGSLAGGANTQYCFTVTYSPTGSCANAVGVPVCETSQQQCMTDYNQYQLICMCKIGCTGPVNATFAPNPCSASSSRTEAPRSVDEIVTRGLARDHGSDPRPILAVRSTTRQAQESRPVTKTTTSSHVSMLPTALTLMSLAGAAYAMWRATSSGPTTIEIAPYATPNGGGVGITGRF